MSVLDMVIAISGMFLVLLYESSMTALLVGQAGESDFSSIKDFRECHIPDNSTCLLRDSAIDEFWNSSIAIQDCPNKEHTRTQPRRYNTIEDLTKAVVDGSCWYMLVEGGVADVVLRGKQCGKLVKAGSPFLKRDVSFVIPPNSTHATRLRNAVLTLLEKSDEPLQGFRDSGGKGIRHDSCNNDDLYLSFKKLQYFFIFAFVSCGLVFVQMVLDPPRVSDVHVDEVAVVSHEVCEYNIDDCLDDDYGPISHVTAKSVVKEEDKGESRGFDDGTSESSSSSRSFT